MTDPRTIDPTWIEQRNALRVKVCQGDPAALAFLALVMDAVEVWDDLLDGDKVVAKRQLHQTFINLLFWLPQNTFFRANQGYLLPVMMTCINAWLDANELEVLGGPEDLASAWYLKQLGVELYPAVAFLKGGYPLMREVGQHVRSLLRHEPLEDYLKEKHHA
jgi:hypothetical protein